VTYDWTTPTTSDEAARRAGGRRRYNRWRRFMVLRRQAVVMRLLSCKGGFFRRGIQAELARALRVSRATICRDIKYLLRLGWPCPHCGAYTQPPKPLFVNDPEEDQVQCSQT
jgi:hypothetical protein